MRGAAWGGLKLPLGYVPGAPVGTSGAPWVQGPWDKKEKSRREYLNIGSDMSTAICKYYPEAVGNRKLQRQMQYVTKPVPTLVHRPNFLGTF